MITTAESECNPAQGITREIRTLEKMVFYDCRLRAEQKPACIFQSTKRRNNSPSEREMVSPVRDLPLCAWPFRAR